MTDPDWFTATEKMPSVKKPAHTARPNHLISDMPTVYLPVPSQSDVVAPSSGQKRRSVVDEASSVAKIAAASEISAVAEASAAAEASAVAEATAVIASAVIASAAGGQTAKKKNKWVGVGFRLAVTVALFVFLLKSVSLSQIWSAFLHLDPAIALIGLVIGLYTLIVSGYQWQVLLRGEQIRIDLTRLVNLYMVGIAFNHFLPTSIGGDVVKVYYVAREGKNMSGSASAAIMARVTGFFGMLLVAYPTLLIWNTYFSSQVITLLLSLSGLVLLMVSATFCLALAFTRLTRLPWLVRLTHALLPRFLREKLIHSKVLSKGIDIGNTLVVSAKKPAPMVGSTLFGVMFHIVACLNYFSFGMALHMGVPFYFYLMAIPLVSLVAFLPVSINGFGLRESTIVFVFATAHVPAATAVLLAFVMDIQMLFFGFVGVCIYLVMGEQQRRASKRRLSQ